MGYLLATLGVGAMATGLVFDVGVEVPRFSDFTPGLELGTTSVANASKMHLASMIMSVGMAFFVGGCVLIAGARRAVATLAEQPVLTIPPVDVAVSGATPVATQSEAAHKPVTAGSADPGMGPIILIGIGMVVVLVLVVLSMSGGL